MGWVRVGAGGCGWVGCRVGVWVLMGGLPHWKGLTENLSPSVRSGRIFWTSLWVGSVVWGPSGHHLTKPPEAAGNHGTPSPPPPKRSTPAAPANPTQPNALQQEGDHLVPGRLLPGQVDDGPGPPLVEDPVVHPAGQHPQHLEKKTTGAKRPSNFGDPCAPTTLEVVPTIGVLFGKIDGS